MSNKNTKRKIPGLPPGTPVSTSKYSDAEVRIGIIDFSTQHYNEIQAETSGECIPPTEEGIIRWIHVTGVHKSEIIESIGENFGIHPLIVEDLVNTRQRPKIEMYDDGVFIVARALHVVDEDDLLASEQVSILLGNNYVVSFQESPKSILDPIIARLKQEKARIRSQNSDYLAYAILDLLIDNYFIILETLAEQIELLEDSLVDAPRNLTLNSLYRLKRAVLYTRRHIWPLREVVSRFNKNEVGLINSDTEIYLRDLYDHIIRATDIIETYRDSLTSMLDIYLSSVSNRMNEIMQLLTVISTIFIPLTLMASIYGMNFVNMPEIHWEYGYPVFMLSMVVISVTMAIYFKRRGWL